MYATNCWVIAPKAGSECVVIDPGMPDVSQQLDEILKKHSLKPVAVIATHGHLDHTFSIQPIADGYSIPAYIHSLDRMALAHPERYVSPEFAATLSAMDFVEPKDVRELRNEEVVELVGMKFKAIHAPGHTAGSLVFVVDDELLGERSSSHHSMHRVGYRSIGLQPLEIVQLLLHSVAQQLSDP